MIGPYLTCGDSHPTSDSARRRRCVRKPATSGRAKPQKLRPYRALHSENRVPLFLHAFFVVAQPDAKPLRTFAGCCCVGLIGRAGEGPSQATARGVKGLEPAISVHQQRVIFSSASASASKTSHFCAGRCSRGLQGSHLRRSREGFALNCPPELPPLHAPQGLARYLVKEVLHGAIFCA